MKAIAQTNICCWYLARIIIAGAGALSAGGALASYPEFGSGSICNGYSEAVGKINKVTATTTYHSTQGVYINLVTAKGENVGGMIYQRDPFLGYGPMVRMAIMANTFKSQVKMCFSGSQVYALEVESAE